MKIIQQRSISGRRWKPVKYLFLHKSEIRWNVRIENEGWTVDLITSSSSVEYSKYCSYFAHPFPFYEMTDPSHWLTGLSPSVQI